MKTKFRCIILTAISFILTAEATKAQWTWSTPYIHTTTPTDKVGMGVSTPFYPLQVNRSVSVGSLNTGDSAAVSISSNTITGVGFVPNLRHALFVATQPEADILFANRFISGGYDYYERMRINRFGRVGIGTPTPDTSALLDISDAHKGVLIPRVALTSTTDATTIPLPANSLLVYCTGQEV